MKNKKHKTRVMSGKITVLKSTVCKNTGRRDIVYIRECEKPGEMEVNYLSIKGDPGFTSIADLINAYDQNG